LSTGKNHPLIERRPSTFATSTGLNSKIGGGLFDHIAQPDCIIDDKPRQTHTLWWMFAMSWSAVAYVCFCHVFFILSYFQSTESDRPQRHLLKAELLMLAEAQKLE
jgi:hypothetical protein